VLPAGSLEKMLRRRGRAWRERPLGRTGMTACQPWLGANCTPEVVAQQGSRTVECWLVVGSAGRLQLQRPAARRCLLLLSGVSHELHTTADDIHTYRIPRQTQTSQQTDQQGDTRATSHILRHYRAPTTT
jgi:hypothetical protein